MADTYVLRRSIGSWSGGTRVQIASGGLFDKLYATELVDKKVVYVGTSDDQLIVDETDLVKRRAKRPKPKSE